MTDVGGCGNRWRFRTYALQGHSLLAWTGGAVERHDRTQMSALLTELEPIHGSGTKREGDYLRLSLPWRNSEGLLVLMVRLREASD